MEMNFNYQSAHPQDNLAFHVLRYQERLGFYLFGHSDERKTGMLRGIHQITIAVFIVGVTIVTISWLNTKDETARIFRPIGLNDFESKLAYEYLTKGVRPDQQMNANKKPREADRAGWPRYHGYGDTRSCKNDWTHKGLIDLFDLWVKMADLLNVNYTLTHGTMIGALRDGDLVPYDQDVDVMMNIDEVPKFAQMIDEHFSDKDEKVHLTIHKEYRKPVKERGMWSCNGDRIYKTQWYRDQCSTQEPLGRLLRGPVLHIDLVGYRIINDTTFHIQSEDRITDYKTEDMLPFTDCHFLGYKTYCLNNPAALLSKVYNDNFMTPIKKCVNGSWVK